MYDLLGLLTWSKWMAFAGPLNSIDHSQWTYHRARNNWHGKKETHVTASLIVIEHLPSIRGGDSETAGSFQYVSTAKNNVKNNKHILCERVKRCALAPF